jgi:hypothetical protein
MNAPLEILLSLLFAAAVLTAGPLYEHITLVEDASPQTEIVGDNVYRRAAEAMSWPNDPGSCLHATSIAAR